MHVQDIVHIHVYTRLNIYYRKCAAVLTTNLENTIINLNMFFRNNLILKQSFCKVWTTFKKVK